MQYSTVKTTIHMTDPSATDFSLFEKIANPVKVSVRRQEKPPRKKRTKKVVAETIDEESEGDARKVDDDMSTRGSVIERRHLDEETESVASRREDKPERKEYASYDKKYGNEDKYNYRASGGGAEAYQQNTYANIEEERRDEKAELLTQLHTMQRDGVQLSRNYDMSDRLEDIEWEWRRQKTQQDTEGTVQFMKSCLGLALTGVEMLNSKLRILSLDGWASSVQTDMHKFDAPLSRIHRRWWRKGTGINPIAHLALLLIGSMVTYHMSARIRGATAPAAPQSTPSFTPSFTAPRAPATSATPPPASRPTMKRPTMSMPRRTQVFDTMSATAAGGDVGSVVDDDGTLDINVMS